MTRDEVLIVSRSEMAAQAVHELLADSQDLTVQTHVIDPRQADPLQTRSACVSPCGSVPVTS